MRVKHLFCFLFITWLFCSCKQEAPIDNVFIPSEDSTPKVVQKNFDRETLTEDFIYLTEKVKLQLDSVSNEEANALYEKFIQENSTLIANIEKREKGLINNYYTYVEYNEKGLVHMPDSIKYKANLLDKAGLEIWDIGEGMVEIRTVPEFYLTLFKEYVTEDYRDFITLEAEDNKVLFDNDAAIAVPWEDAGKRVYNWERFIAKYPDSKLYKEASEYYRYYQQAFLTGADNTQVMDYLNSKEYPEMQDAFKGFIIDHPESPTTPLVKMVLDFKGNQEALYSLITQQQELLKKTK